MKSLSPLRFAVATPLALFAASLLLPAAVQAQTIAAPDAANPASVNVSAPPGPPAGNPSSTFYTVTFVNEPGTSNSIPDYMESMGMRQERLSGIAAGTNGAVATADPAVRNFNAALDNLAADGKPGACLAASSVDSELQTRTLDDNQIAAYQLRIQASQRAADSAQSKAAQFSGDTQSQLRDAVREMDARRADLDSSFANARNTAPNDPARSNLIAAYNRYSEAATRVQTLTSS